MVKRTAKRKTKAKTGRKIGPRRKTKPGRTAKRQRQSKHSPLKNRRSVSRGTLDNTTQKKSRAQKRNSFSSGVPFEVAFKLLRKGHSQKRSAELAGISIKRFRRYLRGNKLARFQGGKWQIKDKRPRSIRIFSDGQQRTIKVRGFRPASLAMQHRAAVQRFLETNDATLLTPFKNASVIDTSKRKHILETRTNVLYRLANAGSDADMKIYRLID